MNTFATEIKSARKAMGLTCKDVAAKVGFPAETITNYETGDILPNERRVSRIADALGLEHKYLLKIHRDDKVSRESKASIRLCGECKSWKKDSRRTRRARGCDVLMGACSERGYRTERCELARCGR